MAEARHCSRCGKRLFYGNGDHVRRGDGYVCYYHRGPVARLMKAEPAFPEPEPPAPTGILELVGADDGVEYTIDDGEVAGWA